MKNEMEKLTDGLTAYVCDTICKHLATAADEAELLAACSLCKLADYRSAIEGLEEIDKKRTQEAATSQGSGIKK